MKRANGISFLQFIAVLDNDRSKLLLKKCTENRMGRNGNHKVWFYFKCINLKSLILMYWLALKKIMDRIYIWKYRVIRCTKVLFIFQNPIGVYCFDLNTILDIYMYIYSFSFNHKCWTAREVAPNFKSILHRYICQIVHNNGLDRAWWTVRNLWRCYCILFRCSLGNLLFLHSTSKTYLHHTKCFLMKLGDIWMEFRVQCFAQARI